VDILVFYAKPLHSVRGKSLGWSMILSGQMFEFVNFSSNLGVVRK